MDKNVIIYTKEGCPYCQKAKIILDHKGVCYHEIDVVHDTDSFNAIKEVYNVKTVPQIFINGKHIGGSDRLMELVNEGKLSDLLDNNKIPS